MGTLTEILMHSGRASGVPIGFMGSAKAAKPKAAAVLAAATSAAEATALIEAGADALVLPPDVELASGTETAWGIDARAATGLTVDTLRAWHERGAAFVVLPADVSLRALNDTVERFDRALIVAPPQDDPLLMTFRALNVLDVDVAVLDLRVTAKDLAAMTVPEYTRTRFLSEALRFPVIITVQDVPATEDMRTLARLGAQGLWLLDATPDTVKHLREELENVPREQETIQGLGGLGGGSALAGR
jgi:hypothetical protein